MERKDGEEKGRRFALAFVPSLAQARDRNNFGTDDDLANPTRLVVDASLFRARSEADRSHPADDVAPSYPARRPLLLDHHHRPLRQATANMRWVSPLVEVGQG